MAAPGALFGAGDRSLPCAGKMKGTESLSARSALPAAAKHAPVGSCSMDRTGATTQPLRRGSRARRAMCCVAAALALVFAFASSAFAQAGRRVIPPPHPPIYRVRPVVPIFIPFRFQGSRVAFYSYRLGSGLQGIWWPECGLVVVQEYNCMAMPTYVPIYIYGAANFERPLLAMKDGTVYSVADYWLVDGELHFITVEENGTKSAEHTVDYGELDVQKTVELDTRRGFRFVLRNEPMEQYLKDHPEIGAHNSTPANPQARP
jgi:hypothetical protein